VCLSGGTRANGAGEVLATPNQSTIEQLVGAHGFDATQLVKVLLLLARFEDGHHQPLLISLRGDQQLNDVKLANAVAARLGITHGVLLGIDPLSSELAADLKRSLGLEVNLSAIPLGYLGPDLGDAVLAASAKADGSDPVAARSGSTAAASPSPRLARHFLRLTDPTAAELPSFVCGTNQIDQHRVGASWEGLDLQPEVVDLRAAQPGDRCLHDPSQILTAARGIEVGHIFQLGRKYSDAMEARFTNDKGVEESLWMGCYGIGVSRLAQAAVEQNHDANGIRWPLAIAPFEVIVVSASAQDPLQVNLAEKLYERLRDAGIDALLDDRDERAGVKFKDADLIGIPWRLVVGRGAADGQVELVDRNDGQRQDLPIDAAITTLLERIPPARSGLASEPTDP
jgi:prolyl-tRNA synthetase